MRNHHSVLETSVLALNKFYAAVRVTNARRAFVLLFKEAAEVVTSDDGSFRTFDFPAWATHSAAGYVGADRGFDHGLPVRDEDGHHDWVYTPRLVLRVPRVIRLTRYQGMARPEVSLTRRNIYARDRATCQYCGKRFSVRELTIDHVVPRSLGGGDSWENLVAACVPCNARKGGRTPDRAGMRLLDTPKRPRRNPLIADRLANPKYASWRPFVDDLAVAE